MADLPPRAEVAHQHHRPGAELVRHDVQVAIVVDVEDDGRSRTARADDGDAAREACGVFVVAVATGGVELEPGRRQAARARFDAEQELGVDEPLAAVVQLDGVRGIPERKVHRRRDEHVVEAVGVEIADARAPRPVVLGVERLRGFAELVRSFADEQRVAPDAGAAVAAERFRPRHRGLHVLVLVADDRAHVRVHVGDEDVEAPVAVHVEYLDAHRAPRRAREHLAALAHEPLALLVLVVLVVALHVEHVQIEPAVFVDVDGRGIARPRQIDDAHGVCHVGEAVLAVVAIQDAALGAIGAQVAFERVDEAEVIRVLAGLEVRGVLADVGDEQVEQAVAVVVEEHGARRVAHVVDARGLRDVAESTTAEVLEERVAATYRCHEEIGIAVVVDVGERRRDTDLVGERHTGCGRDVLEPAAAEVAPELAAADLIDEVDVESSVTIHVGNRHAGAVVVVHGLVRAPGVLDEAVAERDAAVLDPIGEAEVAEGGCAGRGLDLRVAYLGEPRRVLEVRGNGAARRARGRLRRQQGRSGIAGRKGHRPGQADEQGQDGRSRTGVSAHDA